MIQNISITKTLYSMVKLTKNTSLTQNNQEKKKEFKMSNMKNEREFA